MYRCMLLPKKYSLITQPVQALPDYLLLLLFLPVVLKQGVLRFDSLVE